MKHILYILLVIATVVVVGLGVSFAYDKRDHALAEAIAKAPRQEVGVSAVVNVGFGSAFSDLTTLVLRDGRQIELDGKFTIYGSGMPVSSLTLPDSGKTYYCLAAQCLPLTANSPATIGTGAKP